jgi:hypothetical protein
MKKFLAGGVIIVAGLLMFSASTLLAQGGPCTADFDCNGNVDANDVTTFLSQFGRSPYNNPCPDCYDSPCPCSSQGCDPPAPVSKTGQTIVSYTRDDGYWQQAVGVSWPDPRFTDNGDETITDNLTGLMWTKNANLISSNLWEDAVDFCNNGEWAGYTDWRLPNLRELQSLMDYGEDEPALPAGYTTYFINVQSLNYWSSTSYSLSNSYAWALDVSFGGVTQFRKSNAYCYIWPVRGGY